MRRRQARLRAEYMRTKSAEDARADIHEKRKKIKALHDKGEMVPSDLRQFEYEFRDKIDLFDREEAPDKDSEYASAGVVNPKILVTTGRSMTPPHVQFAKELALLWPNALRINRGTMDMQSLVQHAISADVTDLVLVQGTKKTGAPNSLWVCHMPYGPSALFELKDVVMRHQLATKPPPMPGHHPHLIFDRFTSRTGRRFKDMLRFMFPVVGKRTIAEDKLTKVASFVNVRDEIHFRHHLYADRKSHKGGQAGVDSANEAAYAAAHGKLEQATTYLELHEIGPRFTMKPVRIMRGTIDMKNCEQEWANPTFINRRKAILADV